MSGMIEIKNSILPINKEEDDLFICTTSFEDRCRRATELLDTQYHVKDAIVVLYKDTIIPRRRDINSEFIDKKLIKCASNIISIGCDFRNVYSLLFELERKLKEGKITLNHRFITIDITCFTKLHLLLLLKYLSQKTKAIFRFLYTKPLTYCTLESKDKKLSYGFLELVTTKYKIEPEAYNKEGNCCIFFLGHEFERTYKAFELLEPTEYWVIQGVPGYNIQMELYMKKENKFFIEEAEALGRCKYASAEDPVSVVECLKEISQREEDKESLVFVPCGTKPQALGIFMFSEIAEKFNLKISYPMPKCYNAESYSRYVGKTYMTFWSNMMLDIQKEGYNLGLRSEKISRAELYE